MNGVSHSARNTAKNVVLVLLAVLLAVLCTINWLTALDLSQMPADNLLRQMYDRLSGGAVGYTLRASGIAAADPAQIALTREGQLYAMQYSPSEIDAGLEVVRPLWGEVLSGAAAFETASENELLDAIWTNDCALLRYYGAVPLSAVAGWMGGTRRDDIAVGMLLFSAEQGRLYVRDGTNALYVCDARADAGTLSRARESFGGARGKFAGNEYMVHPETLLFEREMLSFDLLASAQLALLEPTQQEVLQQLLTAFGYTPYARSYLEQNGESRVFVDDVTTLRVQAGGQLQYSAPVEGGTLLAYDRGEAEGTSALDAQIDCARLVLDSALRAIGARTRAVLYAVSEESDMTTLTFLQTYNGIPVLGAQDFAVFTFREGVLVSAVVNLQQFEALTVRQTVMPAEQAAVSAAGDTRGMMVAYRSQGGDYVPARYFVS